MGLDGWLSYTAVTPRASLKSDAKKGRKEFLCVEKRSFGVLRKPFIHNTDHVFKLMWLKIKIINTDHMFVNPYPSKAKSM